MSVGYDMSNYYDINAKAYIENTINCDMSIHYEKFLKYLPDKGKILDVGFGSGFCNKGESKYPLKRYTVTRNGDYLRITQ